MTEKMKSFSIGLFVLLSICLSVALLLFLKPSYGNGEMTLRVRFPNIEKISVGSRVTFAGKPVGQVVAINEIHEARNYSTIPNQVYFFELILSLDSSIKVYEKDDIVFQTSGLFGEKVIAIIPKPHSEGSTPVLVNDKIIYSKSGSSIQDTIQQMSSLASTVQETLERVSDFLTANNEELKKTLFASRQTLEQLNTTLTSVNHHNMINSLNEATLNFAGAMESIKLSFSSLNEGGLISNLSLISEKLVEDDKFMQTFDNIHASSEQLKQLSQSLNSPQSSLGRLIHSEDFYLRATSLSNKLEVLFNDINHYGLLFHLDKGWQRTRTKRRNLLDTLSSPDHFQRYYQEEMDQISTSLSRTTLLLRKAEKENLMQNEEFKGSFAELLRRVEGLRASLKVYNEDMVYPYEVSQ